MKRHLALILATLSLLTGASLSQAFPGVSTNDNFSSAAILPVSTYLYNDGNFSTAQATKEPGERFATNSIWFKYVAPASGTLVVDTFTTGEDTQLAIYKPGKKAGLTNLVLLGYNDDYLTNSVSTSRLTLKKVTKKGVYYFQVGSKGGGATIYLHAYLNPPKSKNDNFASATEIKGFPTSVKTRNFATTPEVNEPYSSDYREHGVWLKWTSPVTKPVVVHTLGSFYKVTGYETGSMDTCLAVFGLTTGTKVALTNLTDLGSDDDNDEVYGTYESKVIFNATNGGTYYIRASGYDDISGYLNVTVTSTNFPVANQGDLNHDTCPDFVQGSKIIDFGPNFKYSGLHALKAPAKGYKYVAGSNFKSYPQYMHLFVAAFQKGSSAYVATYGQTGPYKLGLISKKGPITLPPNIGTIGTVATMHDTNVDYPRINLFDIVSTVKTASTTNLYYLAAPGYTQFLPYTNLVTLPGNLVGSYTEDGHLTTRLVFQSQTNIYTTVAVGTNAIEAPLITPPTNSKFLALAGNYVISLKGKVLYYGATPFYTNGVTAKFSVTTVNGPK